MDAEGIVGGLQGDLRCGKSAFSEASDMNSKEAPSRHDNVDFHFLGYQDDCHLRGQVLFRNGEMVLDLKGEWSKYLIAGKPLKHWFEGRQTILTYMC